MNGKMYLAEDEEKIRQTVKAFLDSEGDEVSAFPNGDLLFERFLEAPCGLAILDVLMPGSTGFPIAKKIREIRTVPIISLTSRDSDIEYARASTWEATAISRNLAVTLTHKKQRIRSNIGDILQMRSFSCLDIQILIKASPDTEEEYVRFETSLHMASGDAGFCLFMYRMLCGMAS